MMLLDGQKKCGIVMYEFNYLRSKYDEFGIARPKRLIPEYDYIVHRYSRETHRKLNSRLYAHILQKLDKFDDRFNIFCSWFCDLDVVIIKRMFLDLEDFYFYDFDEMVYESNLNLAKNCFLNDVVFDDLNITGNIINKYSEYVYPIGRIYKAKMILIGCDDDSLHIPNPILSTKQLIKQNKLKNIIFQDEWSCIREYDNKEINYFMVAGDNL